jgi:hypothetical protein
MGKTRQTSNLVSDNNIFVDIANDRVGIGTTVPGYKLDIVGNVNFSGNLTQNGVVFSSGAGGTWTTYTAGIATSKSVGINTTNLDNSNLTGAGNSFKGLYVSNGMIVVDNVLSGNHYIGTNFNGIMAGPVTIEGTLTVDGNYVVV